MKRTKYAFSVFVLGLALVTVLSTGCPQSAAPATPGPVAVTLLNVAQVGGATGTADTTSLALTFDADPTTLAASDIEVTGAIKGNLSGTGNSRTLEIAKISVNDGASVSVSIANPAGYTISGASQNAIVYRELLIGMSYQGGKIAYILASTDPGYVAGETHGLIAANADQSTGIVWYNGTMINIATSGDFGTGQANTNAIIAAQGTGSYAAQVCADYVNPDAGTGVYSDWYLPSEGELAALYTNRAAIGGFTNEYYWASTQMDPSWSYTIVFDFGSQAGRHKSMVLRVRAVRYF